MTAYRDEQEVLRERIEELRRRVARIEASTTPQLWGALPSETAQQLRELQQATAADQPHLALQRLEAYLEALERTVARVPELEQAARALPERAPDPLPREGPFGQLASFVDPPGVNDDVVGRVAPLIKKLDPLAEIQFLNEIGFIGLRARFRAHEAPLSLLYQEFTLSERHGGEQTVVVQLATSVAPATPVLSLRPELLRHVLLKPLGLTRDVQLDAATFDGMFIVDADPADARALLTPEVQQGLLDVARFDIPTLEVAHREALLTWRFQPTARALSGAARALAGIRHASTKIEVSLLRPGA